MSPAVHEATATTCATPQTIGNRGLELAHEPPVRELAASVRGIESRRHPFEGRYRRPDECETVGKGRIAVLIHFHETRFAT